MRNKLAYSVCCTTLLSLCLIGCDQQDKPEPVLDLHKLIYTNGNAYGCLDRANLADINIAAMDGMDKGITFETCNSFRNLKVRLIEQAANKIYSRVEPVDESPDSYNDAWVFTEDLSNTVP